MGKPEKYERYGNEEEAEVDPIIKQLLVGFGSPTADNLDAVEQVEIGWVNSEFGIKIKGKDIFVADIVNALEDMEAAPQEIKEYYRDISDREWQAATRVSTLTLLLFEKALKHGISKHLKKEGAPPFRRNKIKPKSNALFFRNTLERSNNG